VPFIPGPRPTATEPIGIILPELPAPLADGLVGDFDAALEQQFLDVAVAEAEAVIEPDPMADDFARIAVILVTLRVSGRGHIGCLC
jgi:hypothetical protein